MPKHPEPPVDLWDDIEFMSPEQFDPPTPQQIRREAILADMMSKWVDEYEASLEPLREDWLVEPWYVQ